MSASTPKRILYVENGIGYGGAVICLLHLARHLDRQAYLSRIVTGRTGPEYERIGQEFDWRHIQDRHLNVIELRRRLRQAPALTDRPRLAQLLGQCIARLDDLVNFLPFLWGLWREVRTFRPDLIHANNDPLCNRAALLIGRLLGITTICHVRGTQQDSWLLRQIQRLPDHYMPVSQWIDGELARFDIPADKRTVIADGIDFSPLGQSVDVPALRAQLGIGAGAFAVGLVGLVMTWKGQELFLDAARLLRGRIPGLKMLIIGDTPADYAGFEAALRERVNAEALTDTVVFTGHIRNILPVYQALDVVVSASIEPEPLGTMVIEAMAAGRPLVAPNHGGGAEMNTHGETALLFEPGSPEALSEAILRLHQSPDLCAALGSAARARAYQRFSVASHVAAVQAVYRKLLPA
jgi:glycosyltransferase involved in cell wall biosynthesis